MYISYIHMLLVCFVRFFVSFVCLSHWDSDCQIEIAIGRPSGTEHWNISKGSDASRHGNGLHGVRYVTCVPVASTSSTAQGGGGSFKNRKPIGEVGCCESGMAERSHWLTERWLELCLLEWLQWLQWSPHPQLLDVVWCTATVVVVVVVV